MPRSPRSSSCRRALSATVLATLVALALPAPPATAAPVRYQPPVDRPISDPYRAPSSPYGPGNRGIDYATQAGDPVRAAADGEVVFAGQVGGSLHVVVMHADGIRTSYSFLESVAVSLGDQVALGSVVGAARDGLHFGARRDDTYLDPSTLFEGGRVRVHLVPDQPVEASTPQGEANALRRALGDALGWGRAGVEWAAGTHTDAARAAAAVAGRAAQVGWTTVRGELGDLWLRAQLYVDYSRQLGLLPVAGLDLLVRRGLVFSASQDDCTPPDQAPQPPPSGRRILVLVAGFGSAGGQASVLDVDTTALGYADDEVLQFSYNGGRVPGVGSVAGVSTSQYGPADTFGDIAEAGARLRQLLEELRRTHPGVPVDIVAHSQGGLVARMALEEGDDLDPRVPRIEHLVTLGTPHHGADLATADALLGTSDTGRSVQDAIGAVSDGGVQADSVAAAQLREGSPLIRSLERRPLPNGTRVTSVAAEGDLVVPALHSALDGATNALVDVGGATAHGDLPGSPEAARELALALADQPPTCRSLVAGLLTARGVSLVEDLVGVVVGTEVGALDLNLGLLVEMP